MYNCKQVWALEKGIGKSLKVAETYNLTVLW